MSCRGDEHESIEINVSQNSGCKITVIALRPGLVFPGCSAESRGCARFPWGSRGTGHLSLLSCTGYISIQSRLIGSSSHCRLVLAFVRFHGQSWILLPVCSFYKPKPVLMLFSQLLAQDRQEAQACWGISTACLMPCHHCELLCIDRVLLRRTGPAWLRFVLLGIKVLCGQEWS